MSLTTPAARRDLSFHLHPATNLRLVQNEGPLVITRGEGVYVYDDEGKRYLEGMAGLWCASLGFSERRLADAAYRQMCELPFYHSFAGKVPAISTELAERLIGIAPAGMAKALFANSGSEANDTAIKLAWYVNNALGRPQKKKIISRQRAYHGVTIAAASLTGLAFAHTDFDLPIARILHADCPYPYRGAQPDESEEAFAARLADSLEQMILREGPDTVAAFFAEPVMGAGGVIVPPATYFERIQPILRKYDVLFVVDEVICGFGRTGNMFGSQTFDLQPDIITVAKALSAGYLPISANLVTGAALRRPARAERQARHLRPRLHVLVAPGACGRGAGDAEDLRGARHRRRRCAASDRGCRPASAATRTTRWSARRAASASSAPSRSSATRRRSRASIRRPASRRTSCAARSTTARSCATCRETSSRSARRSSSPKRRSTR